MAIELGSSTWISIPTAGVSLPDTAWAVGQWFRLSALPQSGAPSPMLFSLDGIDANRPDVLRMFVNASGVLTAQLRHVDGESQIQVAGGSVTPDTWYFAVARRTESNFQVWLGVAGQSTMTQLQSIGGVGTAHIHASINMYRLGAQSTTGDHSTPANFMSAGSRLGDHFLCTGDVTPTQLNEILQAGPVSDVVGSQIIAADHRFHDDTDLACRARVVDATVNGTITAAPHPYEIGAEPDPPTNAPTLISPENNADPVTRPIQLEWESVADTATYHVEVASNAAFTEGVRTLHGAGLTREIRYLVDAGEAAYWRVRASNSGGAGPWSETWSFTTAPSPITLTRTTPITPAIAHSALNIDTVTWMKPYPVGHLIPTAGKRLVFLYSTDHDAGAGGIHWGVANDPRCTDFEYRGLIWDGDMSGSTGMQSETPWLVHRPDEPRQWWLYFHEDRINNQSGRQGTRLITSNDFVTWVDEGVAMPPSSEHPHTGYATVRPPGFFDPTLWTAHHIIVGGGLTGGVSTFAMSTSPDGKVWTLVQEVDKMSHLPDGMDMGPHPLVFVEIEGQRYGFGFERVPGQQGHALMIFPVSADGTEFLYPRYKIMDQSTITSASIYSEAGKLYVYYTLNKYDLFLAEGEIDRDSFVVGRLSSQGSLTYKAPALPGSYRIRAIAKRTEGADLEQTVDIEVVAP